MIPKIQNIIDTWTELTSIVFVPHSESDYDRLSTVRHDLFAIVGNNDNHPLASLIEVVDTLIEKYESEKEISERDAWHNFSLQMLSKAYGDDEPEYTTEMLKWVNPDYEGK